MTEKIKRKQLSVLRILKDTDKPLSSAKITRELQSLDNEISERTVRLYLQQMDEGGLTQNMGKRGRRITEQGLNELASSRIIERVGFLSAKIDQMTYRMNFDLNTRSGSVVINVTLAEPHQVQRCIAMIKKVFKNGYAMGHLVTLLGPGERSGHITIPENMIGIGTVCSITLNGVLLKYGIPTNSRFGGLLELHDGKPVRFVEIITYDGTSIDPLEVFIRSGMTNYVGAITDGNGRIGASFRELPAESRGLVIELAQRLGNIGLGGFMQIGRQGQALLEIPVSEGRVGAIVIGGLNPVAVMDETGYHTHSRALAGLIDFAKLFHYDELEERLRSYQ